MGGVPWRRLSGQHEPRARGLELCAVQLHRVVAAVRSAVVAQPDEHHGSVAPEVAETHVPAVEVLQDDLRECVGALERLRSLALLDGPQE